MKNYPKVAVVILNWNGRFFLEKFLPSVYNSSYPNIEFVIGDNASTDDSLSFVRASYPKITLLENTQNYGFAGGYNHILSRVEADYFVLLNSDVEVTPNWIEPVIEMLERDEKLVAAQPKILAFHNKAKFEHAGAAGGYLDRYGYPFVVVVLWTRSNMIWDNMMSKKKFSGHQELLYLLRDTLGQKRKDWMKTFCPYGRN